MALYDSSPLFITDFCVVEVVQVDALRQSWGRERSRYSVKGAAMAHHRRFAVHGAPGEEPVLSPTFCRVLGVRLARRLRCTTSNGVRHMSHSVWIHDNGAVLCIHWDGHWVLTLVTETFVVGLSFSCRVVSVPSGLFSTQVMTETWGGGGTIDRSCWSPDAFL
uniref:Uncharacterized protein n=1 Tax=Eutreptiella gymnastica TaxID=73025 RepID=A0A7S4C7S8_9EUGL